MSAITLRTAVIKPALETASIRGVATITKRYPSFEQNVILPAKSDDVKRRAGIPTKQR